MEKCGLITKVPGPSDQHSMLIKLTPEGKALEALEALAHRSQTIRQIFGEVDEAETKHFLNILNRIEAGALSKLKAYLG
jgi:DNA-binding MarR family transcriptional regulator